MVLPLAVNKCSRRHATKVARPRASAYRDAPRATGLKMAHSRQTMHLPLQDDSRPPHTTYSAGAGTPLGLRVLAGHQRADVAIVGGGIAGCSAALHAAEAGARVVLVEANEIGWGASSRNAG